MINLIAPSAGEIVSLQTNTQKTFIAEEDKRAAIDGALTFHWYALEQQGTDRSLPLPVHFAWERVAEEDEKIGGNYFLLIGETPDLANAQVYITPDTAYDVYNLKIGTKYWFAVQNNGKRSAVSFFETALEFPRNIKIDGISNVRDMGGYPVKGGKLRQGLIYRGGEFELHMHVTADGADAIRRLGIKTDLDMRGEAIGKVDFPTSELLGMKRAFVPSGAYEDALSKKNRTAIRKFYKVFTNPKNYPIYFHCWGGADRTGTFAFILGAFLGMKYEDLIYEYEFTSLAIWGLRSRNYPKFIAVLDGLNAMKGETLQEKAATYLKEFVGLNDKQLKTIYSVMVEPDDQ